MGYGFCGWFIGGCFIRPRACILHWRQNRLSLCRAWLFLRLLFPPYKRAVWIQPFCFRSRGNLDVYKLNSYRTLNSECSFYLRHTTTDKGTEDNSPIPFVFYFSKEACAFYLSPILSLKLSAYFRETRTSLFVTRGSVNVFIYGTR